MKQDESLNGAGSMGPEDVASATECTGLIPALPPDDASDAASASLCAIHGAKGSRRKQFRKK